MRRASSRWEPPCGYLRVPLGSSTSLRHRFGSLLAGSTVPPSAALLRADLDRNRALAALAAGGLMRAGLHVSILKSPLGWIASRCAMAGFPACGPSYGLPPRLCVRLLDRR